MFTHICQSNPEKQLRELLRTVLCSHTYWSCCEEILDWSNQPQLKILHVETEDQGSSVLQLRPGTAKQIKYFLKRVF